jgi:3D (Asp-Asp-Asp) domain-containing protein
MPLITGTIGLMTLLHGPVTGPCQKSQHPLVPVLERIVTGHAGKQPSWKLPMVLEGLKKQPLTAKCTTYCEKCPDGGGTRTRWGTRIRRGIVAADPRYWGPGSVVYIGPPVDEILIVEDTGSSVRGPHRFDVCVTGHHALCRQWGTFKTAYVPLYRTSPRRNWGSKPIGWEPPDHQPTSELLCLVAEKVPCLRPFLLSLIAQKPGPTTAG